MAMMKTQAEVEAMYREEYNQPGFHDWLYISHCSLPCWQAAYRKDFKTFWTTVDSPSVLMEVIEKLQGVVDEDEWEIWEEDVIRVRASIQDIESPLDQCEFIRKAIPMPKIFYYIYPMASTY